MTNRFDLETFTLMLNLFFEKFTFGYIFCMVWSLIFHLSVPSDKIFFLWLTVIFCDKSYVMLQVISRCDFRIWPTNLDVVLNRICHSWGICVSQTHLVWINFTDIKMNLGMHMIVYNNELQIKFEFCCYWSILDRFMALVIRIFKES
jgi:hypothetical protein